MSHSASDARRTRLARRATVAILAFTAIAPATAHAAATSARSESEQAAPARVVSSEISLSRRDAALKLELAGGETLELAVRDGSVVSAGRTLGEAQRDGELDRSWRALLDRAIDAPTDELAALLTDWEPPTAEPGPAMAATITSFLGGAQQPAVLDPAVTQEEATAQEEAEAELIDPQMSDSVERLVARIGELERLVEDQPPVPTRVQRPAPRRGIDWFGPFRNIARGVAGILSILVTYTVLFGIGFAVVFFGGRRYIEGVADTARLSTTRSLLVGLAATFLLVPAFILGIIALAVSIVGIPGLLVWIPLFPVASALAILLGYLGVAHAAGEALAERRFYASDWFQRGNSYYFLMSGLALLMSLFLAAQVVAMAGPWLGFFRGLLTVLGVCVTWAALSIGLGAVLMSRAGTRPVRASPTTEPEPFEEPTSV